MALVTRFDSELGIVEMAGFFGPGQSKLFGCVHVPEKEPVAGVVVCSPLQAEFVKNYRREVLLGRILATQGIGVQRFHYRGFGHSDGEPGDATFESMLEDTAVATDHLLAVTRAPKVGFLGTRWGGLIAAAAAIRWNGVPLALWEPAVDSVRYFRDVFRGRLIHDLKEGTDGHRSGQALVEELLEVGSLDILGYSIPRGLYESGIGHDLATQIGELPRPILLIEMGRPGTLRREYSALVDGWIRGGFPVETHVIARREAWWFGGGAWEVEEETARRASLVELTAQWLMRCFPQEGER